MQMDVHKTVYPFYTTMNMPHVMAIVAKRCASLAAIARYIMIIFTIGYLQIFKTRYFFHRSIAITTNKTTNYDLARLVTVN